MNDELNNPSDLADSGTSQPTSSMPPITLPDDYLTDLPPVEEPVASLQEEVVPAIDQNPPIAPMQEFAPMPSVSSTETSIDPIPAAPKGVPRTPIPPSPVNPAMVPDPLFSGGVSAPRVAVDGGIILPHESEEYKRGNTYKKSGKLLKIIGLVSVAVLVPSLALGGYFGYQAYNSRESVRILKAGLDNLITLPPLSSNVSVKSDQENFEGVLKIDQSKNISFVSSDSKDPLSFVYLKNKDILYLGSPDTKSYQAYKNAQGGLELVQDSYLNFALPESGDLTAEKLSNIRYIGTESVGGVANNKYSLSLDENKKKQTIVDLLSVNQELSDFDPTNIGLSGDIWIAKADPKVTKIVFSVKTTLQPKDSSGGTAVDFDFELNQTFDYSFNETIKLPLGAKVSTTTDAVKMIDDLYGQGAEKKAKDLANVETINLLKKAIEEYKLDNESYPETSDIIELVSYLADGDKAYINGDIDVEAITYVYDSKTEKYVLAFKLNDQEAVGPNISGTAPEKVYVLGN